MPGSGRRPGAVGAGLAAVMAEGEDPAVLHALAAGQVRIVFELVQEEGFPPTDRERLWAESTGTNAYRLLNTPWFVCGISKEDHVEAFERDGELFFHRLLHSEGHSTFRVIVYDHEKLEDFLTRLRAFGCVCEQAIDWNPDFIAVDVPPNVRLQSLQAFLARAVDQGTAGYEVGNLVPPAAPPVN